MNIRQNPIIRHSLSDVYDVWTETVMYSMRKRNVVDSDGNLATWLAEPQFDNADLNTRDIR